MNDSEIKKVAAKILRKHLSAHGFEGVDVKSEDEFDGSPVIRIRARYKDERMPTKAITQSLHDIRSKLIALGEDRFVLLEGELLGREQIDEDVA
jgi:hypothetical protein